ncbi:Hint domain-containing protein [Paracoccus aestuarii]|uniref:Hint domain-containing protein n=1 Tax=Paracoccus aestuarii TaxID=453842 RepID=UPI00197F3A92|nr:Hint domain-containing protein [Paracoccus aestuarii]WCQ98460.1 Hint domain-containing protein [Paracoccus aestuarii]
MLFTITVLSVASPINGHPNSADMAFFVRRFGEVFFDDPQVSQLIIANDDDQLRGSLPFPDATGQHVHQDLQIGQTTIAAGTRIDLVSGSVLQDEDGDSFIVIFPYAFDPTRLPWEGTPLIADRTAVLVLPVAREDGVFPVFDPAKRFNYAGDFSVGGTTLSVTMQPSAADDGPWCFAHGTLIHNDRGLRPVEALRPGDLVLARDAGFQPLIWVGGRHLSAADLDLTPNHRPARLLVGLPGVTVLRDTACVTYRHLLLDKHHLIRSEGAWTESLLPGPMALRALGPVNRAAVLALVDPARMPPARPLPRGHALRRLVDRRAANPRRQPVEA